jgi:hypothetical protein
MKKILVVISALSFAAIFLFGVVNVQTSTQDVKKAATEKKMECGKNCSASKTCDPAKCKEGKCDTSKCKAGCANMKTSMKNCDPSKCSGMAKK